MIIRCLSLLLLVLSMTVVRAEQSTAIASATATPAGFDLALQFSDYLYDEPTVAVYLDGRQLGLRGAYTHELDGERFARVDLRAAYGAITYHGTGTAKRQPNFIVETRYVLGHDFFPGESLGLAPFVGIGYRFLYNDLRGLTSTGAAGYRRHSHYLYLPLGLTARFVTAGGWIVAPTLEYDHFLRGRQYSHLSDTGIPGFVDVVNTQRDGHGYRASLQFEKGTLSFGPWVHIWRIADSDTVRFSPTMVGREPENNTREIGIEFISRF
ncbi:MAG TPA: hypothetical protein VIS73_11195 [Rhodocyclaceae bacterium]